MELLDGSLATLADFAKAARSGCWRRWCCCPTARARTRAQAEPGGAAAAAIALAPPALMPGRCATRPAPGRRTSRSASAWAVGCCIAARTDTLRRLGPFDERIFLYGEDLDLGLRAADAGVEIWSGPTRACSTAPPQRPRVGGEPFDLLATQRRAVVTQRRGSGRAQRDDLLQPPPSPTGSR